MRLFELKQKEIINIFNCKNLGYPIDIEFDIKTCRLVSLILPEQGHFSFFNRDRCISIPWECIRQIGEDIILVELRE